MSTTELEALAALAASFNWTLSREDVWINSPYHVEDLHPEPMAMISGGIAYARDRGSNPLGVVIAGERGAGKTHLLGWTREQIRDSGGYFFLVGDVSRKNFWEQTRGAILEQLLRDDGETQLARLLESLADRAGVPTSVRDAVTGRVAPTKDQLNAFIAALQDLNQSVIAPGQDVVRALVLLASKNRDQWDIGYRFLAEDDMDPAERRAWGIYTTRREVRSLISTLFKVIALSGPTVVAVDQIDALVDKVVRAAELGGERLDHLVSDTAGDLMDLRDLTRRTLTVVACLGDTWDYVRNAALTTVSDRFYPPTLLGNIRRPEAGRELIEKRFSLVFSEIGYVPAYPTWPIQSAAFDGVTAYTPRTLLKRIEGHIRRCIRDGAVRELGSLDEDRGPGNEDREPESQPRQDADGVAIGEAALTALDAKFSMVRASANVDDVFDPTKEDAEVPSLLAAGLDAWIREQGSGAGNFYQDPQRADAALHACLRLVSDDRIERQRRWAFRAIASDKPIAVQSRIKKAIIAAGVDDESNDRQLYLLRNTRWPTGPRTDELKARFEALGGVSIAVTSEDLKTFAALRRLIDDKDPELEDWLAARQPAHQTELFGKALEDVSINMPAQPRASEVPTVAAEEPGAAAAESAKPADNWSASANERPIIPVGTTFLGQTPISMDLASLRKHVAIFAGSGSGKTVLLRRVIEECALNGVSSIVLDPNNDLARLGDPWPEPPASWTDDDVNRARRYLEGTDVVVWTPRRQGGRPLAFRPLPAFDEFLKDPDSVDDQDEFDQAVEAAVEAIAPRLNAHKATDKANIERAVLKGALRYFGGRGGNDLGAFTAFLAALPSDASPQPRAPEIAAKLAEKLEAVRENDPLFGGAGEPADPGMLLTPPDGKRARVSVISMIGLTDEQRPGFVNQLQMALFSWIKKHPAGDRPLGGLLVMDEAQTVAPAVGATTSTQSTLKLASQARKYGLGLLFATQAPRALHNQIPNNAATQFFGRLASPAQIDTVQELARTRGGNAPDIGRLGTGEFYLGLEGRGLQKVRTPQCLSFHPTSPLTEEEVLARARRS